MGVGEWREWKECWKGAVEVGYCLYMYVIKLSLPVGTFIYLYTTCNLILHVCTLL